MVRRTLGVLGGVLGVGIVGLAVGCSANAGGDGAPAEKVAATSESLVITNPQGPPLFPDGLSAPLDCMRRTPEDWMAFPATSNTPADPNWTSYTHSYAWGACSTNDLYCQFLNDTYSIPQAHGFKYKVQQIVYQAATKQYVLYGSVFYMQGIQRVDQSWWSKPWQWQGVPAPWTMIDGNSHPPYGADAKSADWLGAWNVAYTYSAGGPNWQAQQDSGVLIESTQHHCLNIRAYQKGPGWYNLPPMLDYFVEGVAGDPINPNW